MTSRNSRQPIVELRVMLTAADYDTLVKFYREALGLETGEEWADSMGRALKLDVGHATLEIVDEQQAASMDKLEAGRRLNGQVRLALQVPDLNRALERLATAGATVKHEPVVTPWGDRNVRLEDPSGMQLTLFQQGGNREP